MAILKNNPSLGFLSPLDFSNSLGCLTLAQRERLELNLLKIGQITNISHGISTGRKHNHDRLLISRIIENFLHII